MNRLRIGTIVVLLVLAAIAARQSFKLWEARSDINMLRQQRDDLIATRNFMLSACLNLRRGMSRIEVEAAIRHEDKDANVEVGENLITYNVLHFWFERDSLTSVDYGS